MTRLLCSPAGPCSRHAALGHVEGPCGALTERDLAAICEAAGEAEDRANVFPRPSDVPALARALRAVCGELLALRRAVEAMDDRFQDADHVPGAVRAVVRLARGQEP